MLDRLPGSWSLVLAAAFLPLLLWIQLRLCFRVRRRLVRLLPLLLLAILAAALGVKTAAASDWYGLWYAMLTLYVLVLYLVCAAGWGIWYLTVRGRRRKAGDSARQLPHDAP